ncbi:MAG: hypothetical protein JWO91_2212 [Acidobacteriaceae bacterium]|nr:hypothetical protein [Acidobacteriaceae bacterium]
MCLVAASPPGALRSRLGLRRTDLLGAFVAGFDGFADNEVKYLHEGWCPMDCARQENKIYAMSAPNDV